MPGEQSAMAKPKPDDVTGSDNNNDNRIESGTASGAETNAESKAESKIESKAASSLPPGLPTVVSPSISPAVSEPVAVDEPAVEPKAEPEVEAAAPARPYALIKFQPLAEDEPLAQPPLGRFAGDRGFRFFRVAASVAVGAVLGAIAGTWLTGTSPATSVAALKENTAMQQSIARLTEDVTVLKAQLDATTKLAQADVTKTTDSAAPAAAEPATTVDKTSTVAGEAAKPADSAVTAAVDGKPADRIAQESAEITGSISAPQTVAVAPVPTPRPAPRLAMSERQHPARQTVVRDWSIRDARGGYIYVEGRSGIYQIVPGAPLPGLGPVKSIKRLEGRWVVTTPKGIIVSMRDRRYFE